MSNSLLDTIDTLRDQYLESILSEIQMVVKTSTPDSSLLEMTEYHLSTGGKRLRALIPLAVADAMGCDPKALIPFGAACEILHNATLVHDDLQDGDSVRRGKPTIWAKFGEPQAINLGDAMLYYTLLLVGHLEASAEIRQAITMRVLNETLRVIDGQEREFALQSMASPTLGDYFRMVEGKTSGLFALPIAGAAEICGGDPTIVDALSRAASHLGVLFQLQDDVLDLYGDKGRERVGSDIAEGKITAMVVHALNHAPAEEAAWLKKVLGQPRAEVTDQDIELAIVLLDRVGSKRFALDEILRRKSLAGDDAELAAHPRLVDLVNGISEVFMQPIAHLL